MFFKSDKQEPTAPNAATHTAPVIFDATTDDFETSVMRTSMETPVIVDFWAPWCGPCKQLMPVLEKCVNAAGGEVLLAKVNLDENPELAQALRVQSVPTVFAFLGGQPVDAFQGVLPEGQIKAFIDKLVKTARANKPGAIDIEETLTAATEAINANDLSTANALYMQILEQDETNAKAFAGLIKVMLNANDIEQAQQLLDNAPEEIAKDPALNEVKAALDLAKNAPKSGELEQLQNAVNDNPDDHQAKIDLAQSIFAAGQKEQAIDILIESIKADQEWNAAAARKALLQFFEAMGHGDPLSVQGRKKLRNILFS